MGTETTSPSSEWNSITPEPVNLSNPLMGTETIFLKKAFIKTSSIVNLSNPLMGTETIKSLCTHPSVGHVPVNLSNPLMGTETWCRCLWPSP